MSSSLPTTSVVDAHVHFWDPEEFRYPWLTTLPSLLRSFGPTDYRAAVGDIPVHRVVVVECNCANDENVREAQYFEQLGATAPVAGIIAYANLLEVDTLDGTLEILAALPRMKGIRHNIQGEPAGFCLQRAFVDGVRKVGRHGLTFDLCVTPPQLGDAVELVRLCSNTTFVLDHCGKPAIREKRIEPWSTNVARLAKEERVACKISGLITEADMQAWQPTDLTPYTDRVVQCFGTDRVMYGSDWPVLTLAGRYEEWYDFTRNLTAAWTESERRSFYHDNATRVYKL